MNDAPLPVRRLVTFALAVILLTVLFIQGVSFLAKEAWPDYCNADHSECSYPGR